MDNNFSKKRENMVLRQLWQRGRIVDKLLLKVIKEIPRHLFVPEELVDTAYEPRPVVIGYGQTISQPYMVASMTQELRLKPTDKVLEIGTGSGYQTAILSKMAEFIVSIERIPELSRGADKVLKKLGISNVKLIIGDGTIGYPDEAPYDKIIVTAGAPHLPNAYIEQLAEGGILVIPVGDNNFQELIILKKEKGEIIKNIKEGCIYVPLIGEDVWQR